MDFKITIPAKRIADLMITGIEGGISYWACDVTIRNREGGEMSYSEESSYKGYFTVHGKDVEDGTEWQFTSAEFAERIPKADQHFAEFLRENEDVETADALIQMAAFNEIVFG